MPSVGRLCLALFRAIDIAIVHACFDVPFGCYGAPLMLILLLQTLVTKNEALTATQTSFVT